MKKILSNLKFFSEFGAGAPYLLNFLSRCAESDRRPHPYQGCALPTELQRQYNLVVIRTGLRNKRRIVCSSTLTNSLSAAAPNAHPHLSAFAAKFSY